MDRCETFTDCRTTIPLSFLKVSQLNTIRCGFYESPNEQNWMCELCTFSQIRSHIISLTNPKITLALLLILTFCKNGSLFLPSEKLVQPKPEQPDCFCRPWVT